MKKKQTFISIIMFLFGMFFALTFDIKPVSAGYGKSYFWGITANFDALSFEGVSVYDDDGKLDEAIHSNAHASGDNLKLEALRCGSINNTWGNSNSNWKTLKNYCAYNMALAQVELSAEKGRFNNSWFVLNGMETTDGKWKPPTDSSVRGCFNGIGESCPSNLRPNKYTLAWSKAGESWEFKRMGATNGWGFTRWFKSYNAPDSAGQWSKGKDQQWMRDRNAPYTWPGVADAKDATREDLMMLEWVNSTIITNYNDAISFILNHNSSSKKNLDASSEEGKLKFLDIAASIAMAMKEKDGTYTIDTDDIYTRYHVHHLNKDIKEDYNLYLSLDTSEPGTNIYDFVKITLIKDDGSDGDNTIVRWRVPKGYSKGQRLENVIRSRGSEFDYAITDSITFEYVVYQAMYNYYFLNQTSMSANTFYAQQGGWLEQQFVGIVDSALTGIESMLGMYSLEELMINDGARGTRYWQGVVPSTWFSAAQYFYLFTFTLSMIVLLIALIRAGFQKSISTIGNVAKKVSLMESIKKIIICSALVVLFQPIFYIMCQVNVYLVDACKGLVNGNVLFNVNAFNNVNIASALVSLIFFYITIKMNFTYMLRGITILLCYLLGPICIMLSALGEKYEQITTNWVKELAGNLFIQTIHALIIMLYINIAKYGSPASIERIVLVYSFVPITEFVRTNLFALGKGVDDVAQNLGQAVGGLATTAATGVAVGGIKAIGAGVSGGAKALGTRVANGFGSKAGGGSFSEGFSKSYESTTNNGLGGGYSTVGKPVTQTHQSLSGLGFKGMAKKVGTDTLKGVGKTVGAGLKSAGRTAMATVPAGLNAMSGLASGATNAQGRANPFQMHSAMRDTYSAAEGLGSGFINDYNSMGNGDIANAFLGAKEDAQAIKTAEQLAKTDAKLEQEAETKMNGEGKGIGTSFDESTGRGITKMNEKDGYYVDTYTSNGKEYVDFAKSIPQNKWNEIDNLRQKGAYLNSESDKINGRDYIDAASKTYHHPVEVPKGSVTKINKNAIRTLDTNTSNIISEKADALRSGNFDKNEFKTLHANKIDRMKSTIDYHRSNAYQRQK